MEKINMKFANIIGILLTICVITIILYPWSKKNIETFETSLSLYDSLDKTGQIADLYLQKIALIKTEFNKNGTVSIDDYKKLINDINDEFNKRYEKDLQYGTLKIKDDLNQNKINEIKNEINYLTNLTNLNKNTNSPQNTNLSNQIKSIKSLESGINLNVKYLKKEDSKDVIMIFLNNGCLTYKDNKYISQYCEITNTDQHFILNKIDDKIDFKNNLNDDYKTLQKPITRDESFYIICPHNDSSKCVKVDLDGISIEDCKPSQLNKGQRWIPSSFTIKSCS
jgi:hypothetical protein